MQMTNLAEKYRFLFQPWHKMIDYILNDS